MKRFLVLSAIGLCSGAILFRPPSLWAAEGAAAKRSSAQKFHGADLAKAPRTTDTRKLPDLWEESPKGSHSYRIRKDVETAYAGDDGTVYYLPKKKCFYIQSDPRGSSTLTYFGPFPGDPVKVLKLD